MATRRRRKQAGAIPRRSFLSISSAALGGVATLGPAMGQTAGHEIQPPSDQRMGSAATHHAFNGTYQETCLNHIAFPMGGIGAGMICLEGTGALSQVSLRHRPEIFNEPLMFAALSVKGARPMARILEGPVPPRKLFGRPNAGNGGSGTSFGLPRFAGAVFQARFPFGVVTLQDTAVPLAVRLTGWSPFEPGDADGASLPVAALEYEFTNNGSEPVEATFSFNARNFMPVGRNEGAVKPAAGGFTLWGYGAKERPWERGSFSATTSEIDVKVNLAWFRGGWFDSLTMVWKDIADGACVERPAPAEGNPSPGATLAVPLRLEPGATRCVVVRFSWYVGQSNLRYGKDPGGESKTVPVTAENSYRAWYTGRFSGIDEVNRFWNEQYATLREKSRKFSECLYASTLPPEVIEAVTANLTILKSPTVMRQADGRLWAWEGCSDNSGCCAGSCTHVWNYAQALPHLFPALERSLRETEFGPSQNEEGHQAFRSALPIRILNHDFHAAADGQLGGVLKIYRDWRISGDTEWMLQHWPKIKKSLDYCIETWDPDHCGVLSEPHHNTYDIEFWGPDGMCTSFYLAALEAASRMSREVGEEESLYSELYRKGAEVMERDLFNGEYYIQKTQWKELRAKSPLEVAGFGGAYSREAVSLLEKEGPKYQYGAGCLSDGVLGVWLAWVCGIDDILNGDKVISHLRAVHRYNLKQDLSGFANPQRPTYACGNEGGLVLCTWPKGGQPSLPFVYSNEVWTGIEYQVASHLIRLGMVPQGLEIVRVCRSRYDGRVRNPFNEYECGHWYARAMSSYALLQAISGARYDAVDQVLYLEPRMPGDFRCFFAAAAAYGHVGVRDGKPFFEPVSGELTIRKIEYVKA